jgi:GNAT superfamily N-acetyltransferase
MNIIIKDFSQLSLITRKHLANATPLGDDYMRVAAEGYGVKRGNYIAIILYSGHNIIGWTMLDFLLSHNSDYIRTYVFVKPQYRRKGYGTLLMKKAKEVVKRRNKQVRVCPWNERSRKFFQSVKIKKSEVAPGYYLCGK